MKFVKYTLLGLAAITLAFFSLGFFHSSTTYENQVQVNASIEDSYSVFITDSLTSQWLTTFVKSELISGSHLTPGSRFLITFEQDGQQFEFIEELIDIKENEKFIFNMETELFRGRVEVYFEGNERETTITTYTTMEGTNLFYKSLMYIMNGGMQAQSQVNYELLKKLIEKYYS
jgi:hypothetical protein